MTAHHRPRLLLVAATSAAWLVLGTVSADAHTHPTPIEKSAPGVVYVEARAKVQVALVEHLQSDPGGVHIAIIQSTSEPVVEKASGFVVDPTGTIVTSGLITATQTDLDRASVYAVNEAFRNRYGDQAPMSGDMYSEQQIGDDTSRLQQRLQACYPPYRTNDAGGCVVRVEPSYVVYPHVTSQQAYGTLAAERLPSSTPDVALLRVRGASGMPTVALGASTEGAEALSALGFTDVPSGPDTMQAVNTHLAEAGGSTLKTVDTNDAAATADATRLADGLRNGMHGGPVVAEAARSSASSSRSPTPDRRRPAQADSSTLGRSERCCPRSRSRRGGGRWTPASRPRCTRTRTGGSPRPSPTCRRRSSSTPVMPSQRPTSTWLSRTSPLGPRGGPRRPRARPQPTPGGRAGSPGPPC